MNGYGATAGVALITAAAGGPAAAGGCPGGLVPAPDGPVLRPADLHASVRDPVLDTMNFLNEITFRYPDAISFAPGRPYDGFFDTEQIFTHIRRYLDHLAENGSSPGQIRDDHVAAVQMKLGLVEDDPAARATFAAVERPVERTAQPRCGTGMRSGGTRMGSKHAVDDFGDEVLGNVVHEVGVEIELGAVAVTHRRRPPRLL